MAKDCRIFSIITINSRNHEFGTCVFFLNPTMVVTVSNAPFLPKIAMQPPYSIPLSISCAAVSCDSLTPFSVSDDTLSRKGKETKMYIFVSFSAQEHSRLLHMFRVPFI